MKTVRIAIAIAIVVAAALVGAPLPTHAQAAPRAFVAAGGIGAHRTYSLTAGLAWPLPWHGSALNGDWSTSAELFVSGWSARSAGERESFIQLGLLPVLRYRFDRGRSDWFAEGGIGLSYLNELYRRDDQAFSTRFNFHDILGVGRSFGAHRAHELALRLVHVSNGGIKKPNPGENFIQLRYARQF